MIYIPFTVLTATSLPHTMQPQKTIPDIPVENFTKFRSYVSTNVEACRSWQILIQLGREKGMIHKSMQ